MKFGEGLKVATFIRRLNRFVALVEVAGRQKLAHVPNSGRLEELLVPGHTVFLREQPSPQRKTHYDLVLVQLGDMLVSADARLPSRLVREALLAERLPPFPGYTEVKSEAPFGDSRLDLRLSRQGEACLIEIKSVTLVRGQTALFPDAPTERGRRHLEALIRARREGQRAAVLFIVQRGDAERFAPNDETDPAFGEALRRAEGVGVEVYAYRCQLSQQEVTISAAIVVSL